MNKTAAGILIAVLTAMIIFGLQQMYQERRSEPALKHQKTVSQTTVADIFAISESNRTFVVHDFQYMVVGIVRAAPNAKPIVPAPTPEPKVPRFRFREGLTPRKRAPVNVGAPVTPDPVDSRPHELKLYAWIDSGFLPGEVEPYKTERIQFRIVDPSMAGSVLRVVGVIHYGDVANVKTEHVAEFEIQVADK